MDEHDENQADEVDVVDSKAGSDSGEQPPTILQRVRRTVVITFSLIALLFVCLLFPMTCVVSGISSKSGAWHSDDRPTQTATTTAPIPQFEDHTCGFLALAAAYRAYGLDPEAENLRFRLGVDRVANPYDAESTGTLHPDLLRVIRQDRFAYTFLDPTNATSQQSLCEHLQQQQLALLLITRRENGNLHWVAADQCEDERFRIVDSLKDEPVWEDDTFLSQHVVSIVCLRPTEAGDVADADPHLDGVAEMNRVRKRLNNRE